MKRMQGRGESFRNVDIFRELLSGTLVEGNGLAHTACEQREYPPKFLLIIKPAGRSGLGPAYSKIT
jgi:hypothetical protein